MQGRLYIDDIDAFAAWGVYLQDGSGKNVVQMPPLKAVNTTEWAEYDGIEADLSNPVLDSRSLQLAFHVTDITGADLFYDTLITSVYHNFRFPRIDKTYRLRLTSCGGISLYRRHGILTLTFAEYEEVKYIRVTVIDDTLPELQEQEGVSRRAARHR